MSSGRKRRAGWNYEEAPIPPLASKARDKREARPSHLVRNFLSALLLLLLLPVAVDLFVFPFMHLKELSRSVSSQIASRSMLLLHRVSPAQKSDPPAPPGVAPAQSSPPVSTPMPALHNSADTECADHSQCSAAEFSSLLETMQRQWALVPQDIRSKCAENVTYPTLEHCVLQTSIPWMDKHPNEPVPWINPKNFDPAIMALCQKNPKALSLCTKP
jgi:hypothetical protein